MISGSRSQRFHGWDEANVWAPRRRLGGHHVQGRLRGGAATVFSRAIKSHASTRASDPHPSGHGLVARHLLFDGLNHPVLTARVDLFGDSVVAAGFYLSGFSAVMSGLRSDAKHRAAGGKAEGESHQQHGTKKFFHGEGLGWLQ